MLTNKCHKSTWNSVLLEAVEECWFALGLCRVLVHDVQRHVCKPHKGMENRHAE